MSDALLTKLIAGAISGLIAAVSVDLEVLRRDGFRAFAWEPFARRAAIGLVTGVLSAFGFGSISGGGES